MAGEKAVSKITRETDVSTTELASVIGVSARRIQQLAQDGDIVAKEKGRYPLCDSVQRYLLLLSQQNKEPSPQSKEKENAEVSIKKAKAIVALLEAKELQGKMHRSEDVAAMTEALVYDIRGMLVALPGRLAVDVAAAGSAAQAAEIIKQEVYKLMEELSNYRYDPEKYEARVRERRSWGVADRHEIDDE